MVHPGRKIVDQVRRHLGLSEHDVRHTNGVMREYGNLSSSSIRYCFHRLLAEGVTRPGEHAILFSMGRGATIETVLVVF